MDEKPHKLLDREAAKADVAKHFQRHLILLRDVVNYGSNLYLRAYSSGKKELPDLIICGVLLRQIVVMIDSAEVLLTEGCINAAHLSARAAFEASIYLDWMLFSDAKRKAACFYISNLRNERVWAQRALAGTDEEKAFSTVLATLGLSLQMEHPELKEEAEKFLAEVNRLLSKPEFVGIDGEFESARKRKGRREPKWHELCGHSSLRQIAKAVSRLPEYELMYSRGSRIVHTAVYKDHFKFKGDQVRFRSLRNLEGIDSLLNFTLCVAIGSYQRVLQYYRPTELQAFSKKYVEDWRIVFKSIPKVSISE